VEKLYKFSIIMLILAKGGGIVYLVSYC